MLVLTREVGEAIAIGENITITVVQIKGKQVRIGIDCGREIHIDRVNAAGQVERRPEKKEPEC